MWFSAGLYEQFEKSQGVIECLMPSQIMVSIYQRARMSVNVSYHPRLRRSLQRYVDAIPDTGDAFSDTGDAIPNKGDVIPDKGDAIPNKGDAIPDKGTF